MERDLIDGNYSTSLRNRTTFGPANVSDEGKLLDLRKRGVRGRGAISGVDN
jgi:hypothetical protein